MRLSDALWRGGWLGILPRAALDTIDEQYYERHGKYGNPDYEHSGLHAWEQAVVEHYFTACRRVLVPAAGGGREVLALRKRGIHAEGFECNPYLVERSRALLAAPALQQAPRDTVPPLEGSYDGVIVGWGAYTLIRSRAQRVAFLRALRACMTPGAPILLSFFVRADGDRAAHLVARVARLLGRADVELGDDLAPSFVHRFTQQEVVSELEEAGLRFELFRTEGYGHAVARSV